MNPGKTQVGLGGARPVGAPVHRLAAALCALLALPFMVALAASGESPGYAGKVVGVTDGDTVTVLDGNLRQHKVRLADIDAPEKGQPFGTKARMELGEMVFGKEVSVGPATRDRYGREIAALYLTKDRRKSVNLLMVEKGMAWCYTQYSKDPAFRAAEQEARSAKVGLWADPEPVPPWEWRKPFLEKNPAPTPARKKRKTRKS